MCSTPPTTAEKERAPLSRNGANIQEVGPERSETPGEERKRNEGMTVVSGRPELISNLSPQIYTAVALYELHLPLVCIGNS